MAEFEDELEDEDSGVFGAILDLNMGAVAKLECDWCGGPHAHNVEHAKRNIAACRAAVEKVSELLDAQAKRDVPITTEGEATDA